MVMNALKKEWTHTRAVEEFWFTDGRRCTVLKKDPRTIIHSKSSKILFRDSSMFFGVFVYLPPLATTC